MKTVPPSSGGFFGDCGRFAVFQLIGVAEIVLILVVSGFLLAMAIHKDDEFRPFNSTCALLGAVLCISIAMVLIMACFYGNRKSLILIRLCQNLAGFMWSTISGGYHIHFMTSYLIWCKETYQLASIFSFSDANPDVRLAMMSLIQFLALFSLCGLIQIAIFVLHVRFYSLKPWSS